MTAAGRLLDLPPNHYVDVKDPCLVHDGSLWHLFGTGVARTHFEVCHATATTLLGSWEWQPAVDVSTLRGSCVAAPGILLDPVDGRWHLFVQTTFNELDGVVEHLVSDDGAATFTHARTALTSLPGTAEAGIYDPHPCLVGEDRYLFYSAFSVIGQPDVHAARSTGGWDGPWERLGAVLRHEDVWCHNQRYAHGYEWGLEAAQVMALPSGRLLMNAVGFMPGQPPGARQRVFLALADRVEGPWEVLGPAVEPDSNGGENGHGCLVEEDGRLLLVHQARTVSHPSWRLAIAEIDPEAAALAREAEDVA